MTVTVPCRIPVGIVLGCPGPDGHPPHGLALAPHREATEVQDRRRRSGAGQAKPPRDAFEVREHPRKRQHGQKQQLAASDIGALLAAYPGEVLRLRFAVTDNIAPFQLGVDNVRIERLLQIAENGHAPGQVVQRRV